jgi:AI-2 transport protein TqsA
VYLLVMALAFWLIQQLAGLLRPLLMAVFLCYVILPIHNYWKRYLTVTGSFILITVGSLGLLFLVAVLVQGSLVGLGEDLPQLLKRAQEYSQSAREYLAHQLPWLQGASEDAARAADQGLHRSHEAVRHLLDLAAAVFVETIEVGFYLVFLLLDAGQWPHRLRAGFSTERAENVLAVAGRINDAMADYLRLKVRASLLLTIPAMLLLWLFGVRYVFLWGLLTFAGNFIPYLGSMVACTLPVVLAFLQPDLSWQPVPLAILLSTLHMLMHYIIEPLLTGKVIDLSPVVILASLSFWGLCWGLSGMFLAVPLTVMLKIVLENVASTRPAARLLAES